MNKLLALLQQEGFNVSDFSEEKGRLNILGNEKTCMHLHDMLLFCGVDFGKEDSMTVYSVYNPHTKEYTVKLLNAGDSKVPLLKARDHESLKDVDYSVLYITKFLIEEGYEILATGPNYVYLGLGKNFTMYELLMDVKDKLESKGIDISQMAKDSLRGIVHMDGTSEVRIVNIDDRMMKQ